jgi:hypothetical protein
MNETKQNMKLSNSQSLHCVADEFIKYIMSYPEIIGWEIDKNGDGIVVLYMLDGTVIDFTVPHVVG